MKTSFIATVLNEENSVKEFLHSITIQSHRVDEIIIVDGGSTDNTFSLISNFQFPISKNAVRILVRKGNRSIGRNEAIKKASNEIILCSDAGCVLDKDWVKNITKPFKNSKIDVVAGYYAGEGKTIFQKCLIPYVLIMPDRVNEFSFLPATRSIAFKKSIWKKAGGFSEEFSNNEDYVFAKKLKKIKANIVFEKSALVYWKPRSNAVDAFAMFYRFAKGDSQSRIFRPKVLMLFFRYTIGLFLIWFCVTLRSIVVLNVICLLFLMYLFWAATKNYKYVNNWRALYFLPEIQLISDLAVLSGTIVGFFNKK